MKKHAKLYIGIGSIIIIIGIFVGIIESQVYNNKILANTIVGGINIGNLTKIQAESKLKSDYKFQDLKLEYKDKIWTINSKEINMDFDIKKTVNKAFELNKKGTFFENFMKTTYGISGQETTISLTLNYNKKVLDKKLTSFIEQINCKVKNATVVLDEKRSANYYQTKLVDQNVKNPSSLKIKIIPEIDGVTVDKKRTEEAVIKNLDNEEFTTKFIVNIEKAKFTTENLKGIDSLLSEYSTYFDDMRGRTHNIVRSTEKSSEILLKPEEMYSFNKLTLEKTLANGYQYAPVINDGKLVQGLGGGVCQVSSTIYNSALMAGMQTVERRNHTIPSGYVAKGRDATVVDDYQDFVFKNEFKHSVFIKNEIVGNNVVSQIFGSKQDVKNIIISTNMVGSSGAGSKTITDLKLAAGKKVVEKYARPSYTVNTYRIYKNNNGETVNTERLGTSYYPGQQGIIRVGAKRPTPVVPTKPVTPVKPTEPTENTNNDNTI